jgi:DNA-binding NtrC family response regulator
LRERPGDILTLAEHFIAKYAKLNQMAEKPLSAEARQHMVRLQWEGNVRALENTMHRAVLLSTSNEIDLDALRLPDGSQLGAAPSSSDPVSRVAATAETMTRAMVGRTVADVERELIIDTLDHCFGNRTHAANILGISIRTLRNKLNQYTDEGVAVPQPGEGRMAG